MDSIKHIRNENNFFKYFIFFILFFLTKLKLTNSLEIVDFGKYYENNLLDIPIKSIHFCQWEFFDNDIVKPQNLNIINQFIYYDYNNTTIETNQILKEIENNKFNESTIKEICLKFKYCGLYQVIK